MCRVMRCLGALLWAVLLCGCALRGAEPLACTNTGQLALPDGDNLDVRVAANGKARGRGLSGVPDDAFGPRDAMLFWFDRDGGRSFVMRDMRFDLDMFFLDAELRVLEVRRGMKAHPGRSRTPPMDVAKVRRARHVVEMRADSPYARRIKTGDHLRWVSRPALAEIGACGHAEDEARRKVLRQVGQVPVR